MNNTVIGSGCELNKAIIAENVQVGEGVKMGVGEEADVYKRQVFSRLRPGQASARTAAALPYRPAWIREKQQEPWELLRLPWLPARGDECRLNSCHCRIPGKKPCISPSRCV